LQDVPIGIQQVGFGLVVEAKSALEVAGPRIV
jgi:hypothetical protein